ncbi:hypothetical protein [Aquimarina longa]|uniref:hypothetical protein n=1 Tax=Aquimarina longa TaxID=1080221 RepID=UPI0007867743|nr:hypothetical protein [Aquimarina longa]
MNSIIVFFTRFNLKKAFLLFISPLLVICRDYETMIFGLISIMIINLRTGIKVYCKENYCKISILKPKTWEHLKSIGLRKTMSKLKDYILVIIAFFFFENYLLKSPLDIFRYNGTELIIVTLGLIEVWSIGENFKKLRGYNIFEYIKNLIIKRDVQTVIKDITDETDE